MYIYIYIIYHVLNSGTPIEISINQTTPIFSRIVSPHVYMINVLYFEYAKYHLSDRLYWHSYQYNRQTRDILRYI